MTSLKKERMKKGICALIPFYSEDKVRWKKYAAEWNFFADRKSFVFSMQVVPFFGNQKYRC